jgi:hypothetical protein
MPPLTGQHLAGVRLDMLGRGFALLDTPPFFHDDASRRLKKSRLDLRPHTARWRQFPQLARYACWLEDLLVEALPEEGVCLASLEFRHERAGLVDDEVDRLHADGSYIRSVFTHYGATTIYRHEGVERPAPPGQTLLMTALDRARARRVHCTLHRRPGAGLERAVIVCSFVPHQGPVHPGDVYREVARA